MDSTVDHSLPPAARGIRRANHHCSVKPCHNLLNPNIPFRMCEVQRQKDAESRKRKAERKEKKKAAEAEAKKDEYAQVQDLDGEERNARGTSGPGDVLQHGRAGTVPLQDESIDDEDEAAVSRALIPSGAESGSCSSSRSTTSTPECSSAPQHQTRIIFMDPLIPPSFSEVPSESSPTDASKKGPSILATNSTSPGRASQVPASDPREAPFATISPSVTIRTSFVPKPTKFIHSPLASIGAVQSDQAAFRAATEAREADVAARVTASLARFLPRVSLSRGHPPGATGTSSSISSVNGLPMPALPNASSLVPSTVASVPNTSPTASAVFPATPTSPPSTETSGTATDPSNNPTPVPATDASIPLEQVKRRKKATKSEKAGQSASTTQTESSSHNDKASTSQPSPVKATPPPLFPDNASLPPGYSAYYVPAPYCNLPYYGQPPLPGMYAAQSMPYPYPPYTSEASPFVSPSLDYFGEVTPPPAYLTPPPGGYGAVRAALTGYMYASGGGWQPYRPTMYQAAPYSGFQPSGMVEDAHGSQPTKVVEQGKVCHSSLHASLSDYVVSFSEWSD